MSAPAEPARRPRSGVDVGLVSVLAPGRRADLRVPFDIDVAALMPELCDHLLPEPDGDESPWTLVRLTGEELNPAVTLAEADVQDGDTLRLVPVEAGSAPPHVTDLVEEIVTTPGRLWAPALRERVLLVVLAVVLSGGSLVAHLIAPPTSDGLALVGLLTGAVAATGSALLVRIGEERTARVLALSSLPLWPLGAAHLDQQLGDDTIVRLVLAGAALVLGLGLHLVTLPMLRPVTAGALLVVVPAELVVLVVRVAGGSVSTLAPVLVLLGLCAFPYAPRLAAATSGLTGLALPAERDSSGAENEHDPELVGATVRRARLSLLTFLVASVTGLVACWVGLIGDGPSGWSVVLIALCPFALLLRAGQHQQADEVLALTVGGFAGFVALAVALVSWTSPVDTGAAAGIVVVLLALLVLAARYVDRVPHRRVTLKLVARRAEIGLRILAIGVAVGATGAYVAVLDAATTLGQKL